MSSKRKWKKVVSLADCSFETWDKNRECPICPACRGDYNDCGCPGPHQDDIYEYKTGPGGVLYARPKAKSKHRA